MPQLLRSCLFKPHCHSVTPLFISWNYGNCWHLTRYMLFCSFLQRIRPKLCKYAQSFIESFLEHSKGLIHTGPYINIILQSWCKQLLLWNSLVCKNQWQENSPAWQKIRISFLHSQHQRILSPDSLSYTGMASAAFPSDKDFWTQLHCPLCCESDQRVNTFCAQFFY